MPVAADRTDDPVREISRGMVAIFKDFVGRGPTEARTYRNDSVLTVILFDTLTRAEKSLAEGDRSNLVREIRREFQGAMRDAAIELVEKHTGAKVKAFMSDHSVYPDYAAEIFILDPGLPGDDSDPGDEVDQFGPDPVG